MHNNTIAERLQTASEIYRRLIRTEYFEKLRAEGTLKDEKLIPDELDCVLEATDEKSGSIRFFLDTKEKQLPMLIGVSAFCDELQVYYIPLTPEEIAEVEDFAANHEPEAIFEYFSQFTELHRDKIVGLYNNMRVSDYDTKTESEAVQL